MPQPYIRQYHIPGVCPVCGRDARGLTIVYVGVQNEALVFRLFYEHFNTICCDTAKSEIGSEQWAAAYSSDIDESMSLADMASDPTVTYTSI